ncbi:MAG: hypothetical protein L6R39_000670 [Caloplaca ligustica]|nr:MAG: hypothetical protein L6R39_000670 [Caloplaca ligustica]
MALPSPSIVSNNFQQMAVVIWNIFPMLFLFLQQALGAIAATVGNQRTMRKPTPRQNLSAVRFAHTFALVVSTATHVAVLSVSLTTVMFPSMFQPGYARALSPGALLAPLATQTTVSSLGQGVQRFLFWDQVFAYSTLLFLGYVLLQRILPISGPIHSTSMIGFVAMGTLVVGPGSVTLALSWIKDEELLGRTEAYQDGTGKSGAVGINAATRRFSGVEGAEKVEHQIR